LNTGVVEEIAIKMTATTSRVMTMRRIFVPLIRVGIVGFGFLLAGCSPPDSHLIAICKATVAVEARGHGLISSDIGELIEAGMLSKGFALDETSARCSNDLPTATNPQCYRPDTALGRISTILR
jgi:hypothetical protein